MRAWRYATAERSWLFTFTPYSDTVTIQDGTDSVTIQYHISVSQVTALNYGTLFLAFRCFPISATRMPPEGAPEFLKGDDISLRICQDPQILAHFATSPWPEMRSATFSGRDLVYRHRDWRLTYGMARSFGHRADFWLSGCVAALLLGLMTWPFVRRVIRARRGLCEHCGYSLNELAVAQCPECGKRA